jgi:methionine-gamma-lyase
MARQSSSAGSTFLSRSGGQAEAFAFLNPAADLQARRQPRRHESLICHPTTTVHSGLTEEARREIGITPSLVRASIGIEHPTILSPIWRRRSID